MAKTFQNLIAGDWVAPQSGAYFENRNPADTSDLIGRFPDSGPARRRGSRAVGAAGLRRAGRERRRRRAATCCGGWATCSSSGKEEIADAMTREMGKVLAETRGDVQEGIDTAYYAATEGRRLFGHTVPSELRNKWAMSYRRPIGVAGLITPFNFPLAIPTWKMFPALLCGNSVVLKPSEDVPHTVAPAGRDPARGGAPARGRSSWCTAAARRSGKALVEHPDVPVISFTGSTETGSTIGETCGRMHKRLSLEMGGKNAMIVMDDADLDLALDGVLWGAFGTTGQRCTATSRLILHRKIHDRFLRRLVEAAERLRLGDGREARTEVGPLIHEDVAREGGALRRDRAERGRRARDRRQARREATGSARAGSTSRRSSRA